jgi:hypothetical protein
MLMFLYCTYLQPNITLPKVSSKKGMFSNCKIQMSDEIFGFSYLLLRMFQNIMMDCLVYHLLWESKF